MKILFTILMLSSLALPFSKANTDQADLTIKKMILSVKPNSCYEETTEEFKKRIENAVVFSDPATNMDYLFIKGDGTYGERLFIYDKNKKTLKLIRCGDLTEIDENICKDVDLFDNNSKIFVRIPNNKK